MVRTLRGTWRERVSEVVTGPQDWQDVFGEGCTYPSGTCFRLRAVLCYAPTLGPTSASCTVKERWLLLHLLSNAGVFTPPLDTYNLISTFPEASAKGANLTSLRHSLVPSESQADHDCQNSSPQTSTFL